MFVWFDTKYMFVCKISIPNTESHIFLVYEYWKCLLYIYDVQFKAEYMIIKNLLKTHIYIGKPKTQDTIQTKKNENQYLCT